MKTTKFNLASSPYTYNVFRNGKTWLNGFNDLNSALRFCRSHDDGSLLELWQILSYGSYRLLLSWN